jgi:hypothetical protein
MLAPTARARTAACLRRNTAAARDDDPERQCVGSVTAVRSTRPRALHLACPLASWPGHDVLHHIRGREHADDAVLGGHHGQRPDVSLVHNASRFTHLHLGSDGERANRHDVADLDALDRGGEVTWAFVQRRIEKGPAKIPVRQNPDEPPSAIEHWQMPDPPRSHQLLRRP